MCNHSNNSINEDYSNILLLFIMIIGIILNIIEFLAVIELVDSTDSVISWCIILFCLYIRYCEEGIPIITPLVTIILSIMGMYSAHNIWHWSWWMIMLFFLPQISRLFCIFLLLISIVFEILFSKKEQ